MAVSNPVSTNGRSCIWQICYVLSVLSCSLCTWKDKPCCGFWESFLVTPSLLILSKCCSVSCCDLLCVLVSKLLADGGISVFSANPKHSPILATMKKINSIPAKTSTGSKTARCVRVNCWLWVECPWTPSMQQVSGLDPKSDAFWDQSPEGYYGCRLFIYFCFLNPRSRVSDPKSKPSFFSGTTLPFVTQSSQTEHSNMSWTNSEKRNMRLPCPSESLS